MENKMNWPPIGWLWQDYDRAAAWYSGAPEKLKSVSGGALSHKFWGSDEKTKVQVPIAADIAAISAGMIFADSPVITFEDEKAQARVDDIARDTML